jgi:rubrerythrin
VSVPTTPEREAADDRLQNTIDDVRMDALHHPDPGGVGLLTLVDTVQRHVREEAASIQTYARLADESRDPMVALVMQLLVEDEVRHHAMFERIAASLQDRLSWASESRSVPADSAPADRSQSETLRLLHSLEEEEHVGAQALRRLARQARRSDECTSCLLLEAMAMDSEKHAHLLRLLSEQLAPQRN